MSGTYLARLHGLTQGLPFLQPDDFLALISLYKLDTGSPGATAHSDAYEQEVAALRESGVIGDGAKVLEALTSHGSRAASIAIDPGFMEEFMNWGATAKFIAVGKSTLTDDHEILARYLWRRAGYDAKAGMLKFAGEQFGSLSFFLREHIAPDQPILRDMAVWNDPAGRVDLMRRRAELGTPFDASDLIPVIENDRQAGPGGPREFQLSPLTLDEGLFAWGSPATVHEFRRQQAAGRSMGLVDRDGIPGPQTKTCFYLFDVYKQLQEELRGLLLDGTLVGSGFDTGAGIRSKRQDIPAERWSEFRLDCRRSRAFGETLSISNIRVREADRTKRGNRGSQRVAPSVLRSSYKKRVDDLIANGSTATDADDWEWAQETFQDRVTRDMVRELRARIAPPHFKKRRPRNES